MPKVLAESLQIPLFDQAEILACREPEKPLQIEMSFPLCAGELECEEHVQLSFSFRFPTSFEEMVVLPGATGTLGRVETIDKRSWTREQLLRVAASYAPGRTKKEVLDFFEWYAQGDKREAVLEHFLQVYIQAGRMNLLPQLEAKAKRSAAKKPASVLEFKPGLCPWRGGLAANH